MQLDHSKIALCSQFLQEYSRLVLLLAFAVKRKQRLRWLILYWKNKINQIGVAVVQIFLSCERFAKLHCGKISHGLFQPFLQNSFCSNALQSFII